MQYSLFLDNVRKEAKKIIGKGGKVSINHVIKNNGCELDGLVIMKENSNISPTVYLNSFYDEYVNGVDFDTIMSNIMKIYNDNEINLNIDVDEFSDYNKIKNRIVYKIINYESNIELLKQVPHKKILDLAVVYYILIETGFQGNATALIYNSIMKVWGVTEEEIYLESIINTPRLLESNISPMINVIEAMRDNCEELSELSEMSEIDLEDTACDMYVLTNKTKINGAACILYENLLYDFANRIDSDLYILPSSIHEVILLPKQEEYGKNLLKSMVREVNQEGVPKEEVLSDNVYEYNRITREITF